jgi:hypothetical protein
MSDSLSATKKSGQAQSGVHSIGIALVSSDIAGNRQIDLTNIGKLNT